MGIHPKTLKLIPSLTPRHEMPKVHTCSLLGIYSKQVTRYMMCFFFIVVLNDSFVGQFGKRKHLPPTYCYLGTLPVAYRSIGIRR